MLRGITTLVVFVSAAQAQVARPLRQPALHLMTAPTPLYAQPLQPSAVRPLSSGALGPPSLNPERNVRANQQLQKFPSILTPDPGKCFMYKTQGESCFQKMVGEGVPATLLKLQGFRDGDCKTAGYKLYDPEKSTNDTPCFVLQSNRYRYWVNQKWATTPSPNPFARFFSKQERGDGTDLAESTVDTTSISAGAMLSLCAASGILSALLYYRHSATVPTKPEPLLAA